MKALSKKSTPTQGVWEVKRTKQGKLPPLHVMCGNIFLCSVHGTTESGTRGDETANAHMFAASKDMYEAICIGLTGQDKDGNPIDQAEAINRLTKAKEKAEGKVEGK